MTKETLLKYMWVMIFIADIWGGCWVLFEKCTVNDWWTFPSLLTILGIGGLSFFNLLKDG